MRRLFAVVIMTLALGAGCGDDGTPSVASEPPGDGRSEASASASGDGVTAGGDCQDATEADGPGDIEMQDFAFAPRCLEISTSQGLRLHNEGDVEHNWSVDGVSGLDVDVSAGDENNTEATGLMSGTYTFFCKYHREQHDMEGTLVVKSP